MEIVKNMFTPRKNLTSVLFLGGLVGTAILSIVGVVQTMVLTEAYGQTLTNDKDANVQVWTELKKQAEPLRIALSEAINCYPDIACDLVFAGHGFIEIRYTTGYEDSYTENFYGMGQAQDIVNNFVKTYGWMDRDVYLNINQEFDNQKASDNKNNDNDNKNNANNDNDDNDSKDDNDNNQYPECDGFTGEGICHDSSDEGPQEGTTSDNADDDVKQDVKDSDNEENEDSEDTENNSESNEEDNEVEQEDNEESDNEEVEEQ